MDFQHARALFPGLRDKTFLDAACVSLAPSTADEAVRAFMNMCMQCSARDASFHHIAMDEQRRNLYPAAAKLFRVEQKRVAIVESTTHGLNIAVNSIPFVPGDQVLIASTEFLQVAIPWAKKAERGEVALVPVLADQTGKITLDAIAAKIGPRTRAICVSSVQWSSGQRLPMSELGDLCRGRGIWLVVDGVHEAGVLDVDLAARHCDFFVTGGHKWLCSPYGCGLMVLSERAMHLDPGSYGYLSLAEPAEGWGAFFQDPSQTPYRDYDYEDQATKFEIGGTGNYPGAIGLRAAIDVVLELGMEAVEARAVGLGKTLREQLTRFRPKFAVAADERDLSGITVFRLFDDMAKDRALLEYLLDNKILVSIRYTSNIGGLRVSTHYYNNEDDIAALVDGIAAGMRKLG